MNHRQLIVALGLALPLGLASLAITSTAAAALPSSDGSALADAAAALDAGEADAATLDGSAETDGGDGGVPSGIQPTTTPDNLGCRTAPGPALPSFISTAAALGAIAVVMGRRAHRQRKS